MSDKYREIVEKINAAFAEGSTEGFLSYCVEDLEWTMVGEKHNKGKAAIREWMGSMDMGPPSFTVDHIIADGQHATAYGDMTMKGEKSGADENYSYCDIYRFEGDKVAELRSYVIKIKTENAGGKNV